MSLFRDSTGNLISLAGWSTAAPLIYRGQHDPALPAFAGPTGGETTFTSPRGTVLHPTGTGVWRYVDVAATGANNGTSPTDAYTTIQAAVTAARAGDSIVIEPGRYPEAILIGADYATETDRIKLCRRGTGAVVLDATNALGSWIECVDGDADDNPNWANIWKTTYDPGAGTIPMVGRSLRQSDVPAWLRVSGYGYNATDQMWCRNDYTKFWTLENAGLTGSKSGSVITLTSAVYGGYASGDLGDAYSMTHGAGNQTYLGAVLTHTPGSNQITATFTASSYSNGALLLNVAKDINAAGQWAFKDNGDGTYTIFFWPYDDTKMDEIRFTEREYAINTASAEYWTIYGVDTVGAGGNADRKGCGFWSNFSRTKTLYGLHFEECSVRNYVNSENLGQGIAYDGAPDLNCWNCSFEYGTGGKGISIVNSPGGWTDQCLVKRVSYTAVNLSTAKEQVFSYSEIRDIRTTHGNGMSLYQGTREVVVWGNIFDTDVGIACTNQLSANIWFGMNFITCPEESEFGRRGLENNGNLPPERDSTVFSGVITYLNNSCVPSPTAALTGNYAGMATGRTTNATHNACNNVSMGGPDPYQEGALTQPVVSGAYSSALGRYQDNVTVNDTETYPGPYLANFPDNVIETDPNDVWTDYTSGDYSAKAGGPIDRAGGDHSDLLPTGAWIDWFDMSRDLNGVAFDWAVNPPIGAMLPD